MHYIVHAPNYVSNSAGVRCLYILADELNKRGLTTFITGSTVSAPGLRAPLMPLSIAKRVVATSPVTVVYPETVHGNPLGAIRVARWVLNSPGLLGGDSTYDDHELIFTYSDYYRPFIENKVVGKIHIPTIDQSIFFDDGRNERSLECFYVGKSSYKPGYVDADSAFEVTRYSPQKSELGKLFRHAKILYCFDNSSIIAFEAALCGCPAVIIPDGTQTQENFARQELGMHGVAWGLTDLPRARASLPELATVYDRVKREVHKQIDDFVAMTLLPSLNPVLLKPTTSPDLEYCKGVMQALIDQQKLQSVHSIFNASGKLDWRARFWNKFIYPLQFLPHLIKLDEG